MCRLGNTVFERCNSTGAVRTVTVAIFINVIQRNRLAPGSAPLEFNVVNVDAGVDDIYVNAFATVRVIFVLGEGAKRKLGTVADSCETLTT